jgi:hypothetical protein
MKNYNVYIGVIVSLADIPKGTNLDTLDFEALSHMKNSFTSVAAESTLSDALKSIKTVFVEKGFKLNKSITRYKMV